MRANVRDGPRGPGVTSVPPATVPPDSSEAGVACRSDAHRRTVDPEEPD